MLRKTLTFKSGEYWYGGAVNDGYLFPVGEQDSYRIDLTYNDTYNQVNPLFISSHGRYVWLEKAGIVCFEKGVMTIDAEEMEIDESCTDLRSAYKKASQKHFPPCGNTPPKQVFRAPQICSWIDLQQEQNQEGILSYARSYVQNGGKAGLIIIDDKWQRDYGDWEFNEERFPDPKAMMDELHALGFDVAVWLVPYVTPDTPTSERLLKADAFLKDESGKLLLADWFDGVSYVLDFTKQSAVDWLGGVVKRLKERYGLIGFKLDCGDAQYLDRNFKGGNEHNLLWAKVIDGKESLVELRACYKFGGSACVQRLADKAHSWGVELVNPDDIPNHGYLKYGFSAVLPAALAQGVLGYYFSCPDMVGGGLASDFEPNKPIDNELLIRWCQASTLMPAVQFSYAYWNSPDERVRNCMKACMAIREEYLEYILFLIDNAARTGEPIVRYMEYEFPHDGLASVTEQYMLGDKYLVAPVLKKGQTQKEVYFPTATKWKQRQSGNVFTGGKHVFDVTLETLLVFERMK
ncbi:MAG: glycoside hydrolase [Clostridia bacterium]|nr:glycoside hydrolase [Clostridia bacterium]